MCRPASQVVGFLVLVSGTSLYNELIRSCLPQVYSTRVDSDDTEACSRMALLSVCVAALISDASSAAGCPTSVPSS